MCLLQPLKMHCKSCALVTSSGHLLGSKQGNRIDQTECVIRMNDAPTRGYGKDVGNKTSLRVIAHSSIQRILRNRNELLNMSQGTVFIFWGPSSYMRRDGKGLVYNNLQLMNQILPQLKVYMISRHKMLQFDDLFKQETGKDRWENLHRYIWRQFLQLKDNVVCIYQLQIKSKGTLHPLNVLVLSVVIWFYMPNNTYSL